MKRFLSYFIILTSAWFYSNAQELFLLKSVDHIFYEYELLPVNKDTFQLIFPFEFSAFAILIPSSISFNDLTVEVDGETIYPERFHETDVWVHDSLQVSELIFLHKPIQRIILISKVKTEKIIIHTFHPREVFLPENLMIENKEGIDCSKPFSIDQDIWRAGLPAPVVKPTFTKTHHLVLHHTAGSNTSENHLSDVRNIYLYHTQTLGWDDIGYNYLIARDGTIYSGRDGQGIMDDDYTKGAHFCGKNANTMGISMMGEYSITFPTPQALLSLKKLLLWKCHKDTLRPFDSLLHPAGSDNPILLPVICGHRDGCSTECPGTSFYLMLPAIKAEIDSLLKLCFPLSVTESDRNRLAIITQNTEDNSIVVKFMSDNIIMLKIYNITGQIKDCFKPGGNSLYISTDNFSPGIYLIQILSPFFSECYKFVIQ